MRTTNEFEEREQDQIVPPGAEPSGEQDAGWMAHVTWTQIGTALNTVGVFFAIALGAVALGVAVNNGGDTKVVTQAAPAAKAAPTAAAVTGPVAASLGDGPGGPPNAGSMWIALSRSATAADGKVAFNVKNVGQIVHEFVVIKTDKRANGLGTGQRVPEDGNVGETGDVQAGASKSLSLKLKPGHYALICNIPGHYAAGMHADFIVR
jgi:uncharacterized cupredoxin-like copper-binding protein